MRDGGGNQTAHLLGVMYKSLKMKEAGIEDIWVIDGQAGDMKQATLKAREEFKLKSEEGFKESLLKSEHKKALSYSKRILRVSKQETDDLIKLLQFAGCSVGYAVKETDHKVSLMTKAGLIEGVMSEDSDLLVYGVSQLIRTNSDGIPSTQKECFLYREPSCCMSLDSMIGASSTSLF